MTEPVTRGQPDWGPASERTFTNLGGSDVELSARLKWPLSQAYDGEIVFYDDFEAGVLHWDGDDTVDSTHVHLSSQHANSGDQSVELVAPAGVGESAWIARGIDVPYSPILGFGVFIHRETEAGYFELSINPTYSNQSGTFTLRYNWGTGLTEVRKSTGWVTIGTFPSIGSVTHSFPWFQLVIDADTMTYKRARVGSTDIALSGLAYNIAANPYADKIQLIIEHYNGTAADVSNWVDDVIVTRNVQLPQE